MIGMSNRRCMRYSLDEKDLTSFLLFPDDSISCVECPFMAYMSSGFWRIVFDSIVVCWALEMMKGCFTSVVNLLLFPKNLFASEFVFLSLLTRCFLTILSYDVIACMSLERQIRTHLLTNFREIVLDYAFENVSEGLFNVWRCETDQAVNLRYVREDLQWPKDLSKLKTSLRQGSEIEWIIHENLLLKLLSRLRMAIVSRYEAAKSQGKRNMLSKRLKSLLLGRIVFFEILSVLGHLWSLLRTMRCSKFAKHASP